MMRASSDEQTYRRTDLQIKKSGSGLASQRRNEELERRMLEFSVGIIRELDKHRQLPRSVTDQLVRSSTSIGANYAEACNSVSKADFKNKIAISKKEAAESRYWIDLCQELIPSAVWAKHRQEAHEILLVLQSIINSLKSGPSHE